MDRLAGVDRRLKLMVFALAFGGSLIGTSQTHAP